MNDAVLAAATILSILASILGVWSALRRRQLINRLLRSLDPSQREALANSITANDFDARAKRFGWQYDNGGRYQNESWDWYYSAKHQYGDSGNIVLARQSSGLAVLLHFQNAGREYAITEVWRGSLAGHADLERATATLNNYIAARPDIFHNNR